LCCFRVVSNKSRGGTHGNFLRFGEQYRRWRRESTAPKICEVCGGKMDIDPEIRESHCPFCEDPGA